MDLRGGGRVLKGGAFFSVAETQWFSNFCVFEAEQPEKAIYLWNNAKSGLDVIALLERLRLTPGESFFAFSDSDHTCCKPEQNQYTLSVAFRPDHLRESVCGGQIMDVS